MATDLITAALDQLAAHAEQIAQLDARENSHHTATSGQIAALADLARDMDAHITALASRLAPVASASSDDGSSGEHARPDDDARPDEDAGPYTPEPSPRWWKLAGEDREQAIGRLRAWVDQISRPGYGQLAAALGSCWDQHPLCLYGLDILAELWSVLHLAGTRTPAVLSAQAEFQARILPALAEQMQAETTRCPHARTTGSLSGYARSRP